MKNLNRNFSIVAIICIFIMQLFICFKIVTFEPQAVQASAGFIGDGFLLGDEESLPLAQIPTPTPLPTKIMGKAYINGAVKNPGVHEFEQGMRVVDLIEIAGGALEEADLERINLAAYVDDACHIVIPAMGVEPIISESAVAVEPAALVANSNGSEYVKPAYTGMVNINTADIDRLMSLPGVGQTIAQNIINYRTQSGNFTSKEQLKNVSRIGDLLYNSISEMITI